MASLGWEYSGLSGSLAPQRGEKDRERGFEKVATSRTSALVECLLSPALSSIFQMEEREISHGHKVCLARFGGVYKDSVPTGLGGGVCSGGYGREGTRGARLCPEGQPQRLEIGKGPANLADRWNVKSEMKISIYWFVVLLAGVITGCSISRLYPTITGDTRFTDHDHWVFLRLAGYDPESLLDPGPNAYAQAFALAIDEGSIESVKGSYRFASAQKDSEHPLKLIHLTKQRAVMSPVDHVATIGPGKIPRMKEGRYYLSISYRVNGQERNRRFKVDYLRKVDWGIETIKLPQ
jgi:hypothetical protein